MKISKEDYGEIKDFLQQKRWEGEEYVAFCDVDYPICKDELYTFQDLYEAKEFCYEMTTDVDNFDYLSIRSVYRAMSAAENDHTFLIETDNVVDLSNMVTQYYARLKSDQNSKVMNEKNYEYVSDQLKYTGFGDSLTEMLKKHMETETGDFTLIFKPEYGKGQAEALCHFRKSEESGMVFFNKFDLQVVKNDVALMQTFYIGKNNNFTLKEAFNLMHGRSVFKELVKHETDEKYKAWVKLDFKETDEKGNLKMKYYHENYGYNLSEQLEKLPIDGLGNQETKEQIQKSLQRGNQHVVSFAVGDQVVKGFIEAEPQFKTIRQFDENGKSKNFLKSETTREEITDKKKVAANKDVAADQKNTTEKQKSKRAKKIGS